MTSESYLFTLDLETPLEGARPGRFVLAEVPVDTALRRPFSIAGSPDGAIELLVERRGRGTEALAALAEGAAISIIGPLGNGFTPPAPGETAVLVAGGIGAAGLRYLAADLRAANVPTRVLVGARTAGHLLDRAFATAAGATVETATDDGTSGLRGTVVDLLERALGEIARPARVYCCGPPGMIRAAARTAAARGVACEASIEEIMACGVGACRGCVVETTKGYRTVCKDGPVFDTAELVFEGEGDGRS